MSIAAQMILYTRENLQPNRFNYVDFKPSEDITYWIDLISYLSGTYMLSELSRHWFR